MCAYAQAFADTAAHEEDAAAIIVTTICDQMRRSAEEIAAKTRTPVFLMNVPHTWRNPGSHKLYRDEIERLGRFFVSLGGEPASNDGLIRVMKGFDETRACVRESRPLLTARLYSESIASFNRDPSAYVGVSSGSGPLAPAAGAPVAIIGGPLMGESFEVLDLIERAGGYVALDGTETGERALPAPFDRRRLDDDPLGTLCEAYFGGIPDPARRPNSEFFKWLGRMIEERGIRGLIVVHYLWCDIWRAELRRIAEWSKLPVLPLDAGDGRLDPTRTMLRLEAFFEVTR